MDLNGDPTGILAQRDPIGALYLVRSRLRECLAGERPDANLLTGPTIASGSVRMVAEALGRWLDRNEGDQPEFKPFSGGILSRTTGKPAETIDGRHEAEAVNERSKVSRDEKPGPELNGPQAELAKAARRLRAQLKYNAKFIPEGVRSFITDDIQSAIDAIESFLDDTTLPSPLSTSSPTEKKGPLPCPSSP